jgi:hypothetical protein
MPWVFEEIAWIVKNANKINFNSGKAVMLMFKRVKHKRSCPSRH